MDITQVKTTCVSKKEIQNWDKQYPIVTEIELQVPYDQSSIYHKLSGGTNMVLRTVNQDAADMFKIGSEYMMEIRAVEISPIKEGE